MAAMTFQKEERQERRETCCLLTMKMRLTKLWYFVTCKNVPIHIVITCE